MPTIQKAYRYRLRPTPAQDAGLMRFAGSRRYIWNWAHARRQAHFQATGETLTVTALCAELTALKRLPATAWLREMDSQALQQAIRDLDRAYRAFFEKRARFPRFKARKRDTPSFRIPQRVSVENGHVLVPKIGAIRLRQHRPLEGSPKSATFTCDALGHWYVSIVVHVELPDTPLPSPDPARTVGLDAGLKDLAVLSNGVRFPAPRFYRAAERKLARMQRHLSRCRKGSTNREKARRMVARQHRRVANQRRDLLHTLTTTVVRAHDAVCIETLTLRAMARTKLAKSVQDAAIGLMFFMLRYKTVWQRKHLAEIGRFYPSSRLCGACGAINDALTLSDRVWTCACGVRHDRDLNAARNIRREGLRLLAEGCPEST